MRTSWRFITLTVVVLLVILFFGITNSGSRIYSWNRYKPEILDKLKEDLACSRVIVGKISGSILKRQIYVSSVQATYTDGLSNTHLACNIYKTVLDVSLVSILTKSVKIKSISIERPIITSDSFNNIRQLYSALGHMDKSISNITVIGGRLEILDGGGADNIQGSYVRTPSTLTTELAFTSHNKKYNAKLSKRKGYTSPDINITGEGLVIEYVADNKKGKDGKMYGTLSFQGKSIIPIVSLLIGNNIAGIALDNYDHESNVTGTGLGYCENSLCYLNNFRINSEQLKATVNSIDSNGIYDLTVDIDYIDVDGLRNDQRHHGFNYYNNTYKITDNILNIGQAHTNVSVNVRLKNLLLHQQQFKNISLALAGNGIHALSLRKAVAPDLPFSSSCSYTCNDAMDNNKCVIDFKSNAADGFLTYIGFEPQTDWDALLGNGNQLNGYGVINPGLGFVVVSDIALTTNQIGIYGDLVLKALYNRIMIRGDIRLSGLPVNFLWSMNNSIMRKVGDRPSSEIIVKFNTFPFDFGINVDFTNLRPNGGGHAVITYNDFVLSLRDLSLFSRDKYDLNSKATFYIKDMQPTLDVGLDGKLLTIDSDDANNTRINISEIVTNSALFGNLVEIFNGTLSFALDTVIYKGIKFEQPKINIGFGGNTIIINQATATAFDGGKIDINGSIGEGVAALSIKMESFNCETFARAFFGAKDIRGYGSVLGVIKVSKSNNWLLSTNGNIGWAIADLTVVGLDIATLSRGAISIQNQSQLVYLLDLIRTNEQPYVIGNVSGTTTIKGGIATNNYSFTGNYANGSGICNILMTNGLMSGLSRFMFVPVGGIYQLTADVIMKGSVFDPDISFDVQKLSTQLFR